MTIKNNKLDILNSFKVLALAKAGLCLSTEYVNSSTKLKWQCSAGHQWEALPDNVKKGHWCKICGNIQQGNKKRKTLDAMHALAKQRNGLCLSEEYKGNKTKLRWRCSVGHEWEAIPASVSRGTWCPICAGKKPKQMAFAELQEIAKQRGGSCLSRQYKDVKTKLSWQCAQGHIWSAIPETIKNGTWCPYCSPSPRIDKQSGLAALRSIAESNGGRCLSETYTNANYKYMWRCSEGHEWQQTGYHVKAGHWCPYCSAGLSERVCRALLEKLTGHQFPKDWPEWLRNENGNKMELDGYCEALQLAFEYQGEPHYKHNDFFHNTHKSLLARARDDELKRQKCKERNIQLIEVPFTVTHENMQEYLMRQLREHGFDQLQCQETIQLDSLGVKDTGRLKELQQLAKDRGGECLSDYYLNNNTKLHWRCAHGHEWQAVPSSIKSGSWCPKCKGRLSAEERMNMLLEIVKSKGGECLSREYVSIKEKMRFACAKGHVWEALPESIFQGGWCRPCSYPDRNGAKRLGLEKMREIARSRGGECLSTEYKNTASKLRWRCAKGHEWEAIPDSVCRIGTWCPVCIGRKPRA